MKNVIRVGDPTSHGGKVMTGASNFEVDGCLFIHEGGAFGL